MANRHFARCVMVMCVVALLVLSAVCATAQTTQFTYQGLLNDGGSPANGAYDLQFNLFDTLSGGTQQGATVTLEDVSVSNGIFKVTLDFGAAAFPGATRFLEIGVRPGASTGVFTLLTPRQPLTSTPYAIHSLSATTADSAITATTATNATNAASAVNFSGNLAGDVTGVQSATILTNNTVTTTKLVDRAVTSAKLSVPLSLSGSASNTAIISGTNSTNTGSGVRGENLNSTGGRGVLGEGFLGVHGKSGESGAIFDTKTGVVGESDSGTGVVGVSQSSHGVAGAAVDSSKSGVYGVSLALSPGVGVFGEGGTGVKGSGATGVHGVSASGSGYGVHGENTGGGWAGYFDGNVTVTGMLSGNGSVLTNLNAANITAGTLDNARLGTVPIAKGGTGITTAPAAAGQFLRSSGAGVWTVNGIAAGDLPAGNGNYIQNATTLQAASNFNISGNGAANILNAMTQFNLGGSRVLSGGPGTGVNNFLVGLNAGNALTNGRENTFVGGSAGQAATGGGLFCASCGPGASAVYFGSHNAIAGYQAGTALTTGYNNSIFGNKAGFSTTSANGNSFFGNRTGYSNTGSENSFFGAGAGFFNVQSQNSFFGFEAGFSNTIANGNSFFGWHAGYATTEGTGNSFFGHAAGSSNTFGGSNTFFGNAAGFSNTTGNVNVMLGANADFRPSAASPPAAVLGNENLFIGFQAGGASSRRNATAIGANAFVGCDDCMVLGNSAVTAYKVGIGTNSPADKLHVAGDIRIGTNALGCVKDADGTVIAGTCFSDLRFKRDVAPFPNLLDKLVKLQPVNFFWRSSEFPQRHFGTEQSYGLIAQEVEAVLPELVSADAEGFKAVNYSKLPLLLLQGMKEQQQLSQQLKQENTELKQQLAAQQLRAQQQEREVRELKRLVCLSVPQADVCQPPR